MSSTQSRPSAATLLAEQTVHEAMLDIQDERARVRLGAAPDTAPIVLTRLASDAEVTVRAAVAMNPATPGEADMLLANDGDARVRTLLARKLAGLIPSTRAGGISQAECDRLGNTVLATLTHLVEDEAVRVRTAIADVLKDMPEAPRALILRLANDSALSVFDPVIRLSPLLTEEDLLALTRSPRSPATMGSIARRADLPESVCDAIAATADSTAIARLLENRSAAIREATLDSLILRAANETDWHAPLVRRPRLSPASTRALADMVATQLLDELASRADLSAGLAVELRRRLAIRLEPGAATPRPEPRLEDAMAEAARLAAEDNLTEDTLLLAIQRAEARRATALLAVAAEVPASVVERAATLRSAKGLVSLVWKAGMTMRVGGPIQVLLARAAPTAVLRATANGGFPLALEEMRFQIDFLTRMGR